VLVPLACKGTRRWQAGRACLPRDEDAEVSVHLQPSLKEGGRDSQVATGWLRHALVVGEIAASVVLVAAAILLARSFARLLDVDSGFNPSHLLTLRTSLPVASYPNAASMVNAHAEVGRRLRESPAWKQRARSPGCRWRAHEATGASGSKVNRSIGTSLSRPTGR
jgi:hypothetical protein